MKSQPIFGIRPMKELRLHIYKITCLTHRLMLPHYLAKCKKWFCNNIRQ